MSKLTYIVCDGCGAKYKERRQLMTGWTYYYTVGQWNLPGADRHACYKVECKRLVEKMPYVGRMDVWDASAT